MNVEINIPSEDSLRILRLLTALGHEFSDVKHELLQVAAEAREGITLEVKPIVHPHTHRQRAYYWKWLREFAKYCGTTPDETHKEILCVAYGSDFVETKFGLKRRPQKRSSEATRPEYSDLIDTLIRVSAEMDFVIPPPIRAVNE